MRRTALAVALLIGVSACSTPAASPGDTSAPSGQTANLPSLNLANVTTDTAAARGATLGPDGGMITARGSNGATYTLTIPPRALHADTAIGIYPVEKLNGLPTGSTFAAGAQFTPDGLQLTLPATFAIDLPAGVDAATTAGLAWSGDGAGAHEYPAVATGQTFTMQLLHFSGAGAGNGAGMPNGSLDCPDLASMDALLEGDHQATPTDRSAYTRDMKTCYRQLVLPAMEEATAYAQAHDVGFDANAPPVDAGREFPGIDAYGAWRLDMEVVDAWLGGSGFQVTPELADSLLPAKNLLRAWYDAINDECIAGASPTMDSSQADGAILLADLALTGHAPLAEAWGVATVANKLDLETLLNDLCVRVVIDPSRDFSGAKPGDTGTLIIPVGYTIAGGPARHDRELDVEFGVAGSPDTTLGFSADVVTHDFAWPADKDPLQIDLRATMPYPFKAIARFDRITKGSKPGRITYRSDATADHNPQLFVMDEDGTNAKQLTNDTPGRFSASPAFSPDGTTIAFASARGGPGPLHIWVMDATGANAKQLTSSDASEGFPAWSPDGRQIAFVRNQGIFVIDSSGGNLQQLTSPTVGADVSPDWSPDGSLIAFNSTRSGRMAIWLMDPLHPADAYQLKLDGNATGFAPAWSPDGSAIAFVRFDGKYSIYTMHPDGLGLTPVYEDMPGLTYPAWSPDGTKLLFTMPVQILNPTSEATQAAVIFRIGLDGSGLKDLTTTGGSSTEPDWGPAAP